MSVSAETIISAPSESYALSADQMRPRQPETCSFYSPLIKMLEGEILTLQMSQELTGMMLDRQRFIDLSTSRDIADRELYFGTPETNGNQRLIIVNGFTQYNPATENPWVAPIFEYWQNIFPP